MALVADWCSIKQAHWQKESLDFSLWISPLPGEIPFIVYFPFINLGFSPLPVCDSVIVVLPKTLSKCQEISSYYLPLSLCRFCQKLADGKCIIPNPHDWPLFLFNGGSFDITDLFASFLCNEMLVWACVFYLATSFHSFMPGI